LAPYFRKDSSRTACDTVFPAREVLPLCGPLGPIVLPSPHVMKTEMVLHFSAILPFVGLLRIPPPPHPPPPGIERKRTELSLAVSRSDIDLLICPSGPLTAAIFLCFPPCPAARGSPYAEPRIDFFFTARESPSICQEGSPSLSLLYGFFLSRTTSGEFFSSRATMFLNF